MYIDSLQLRNFRNYKENVIDFSKNYNIIYGENAQGKTNIVEAIFLCASGRSHRTSKDIELVNINSNSYDIKLDATKNQEKTNIEISYEREKKKVIKINEIPLKKMGNLMGNLLAVIFSPEDLSVINEGPSQRRRFIDITLSQIKPSYFYDLQLYNKILLQRNSLLKELQNNRGLIDTLDIWDEKIADIGSRIIKARHEFINRLNKAAKYNHSILSDNNENIEINYSSSVETDNYEDIDKIKANILMDFKRYRYIELKRNTTLKGPHRDDYEIFINNLDVKSFGSQGQKRTVILSIKLSELQIIKEETGEYPVLLLDDVMSELDYKRREILFDNINHIQTFITCTEKDIFDKKDFKDLLFVNVKNGNTIIKNI
ncbi:DNA replication/repair protein RecF [Acetivibrio cellulolyticus]|uniref:DNA replication/repair protein RecF n=1 Tax=Acetivibrio cellulolyticus TaxID=35830 RepID=UPI0001E2EBB9|nr:DNA replication/repair protein RecF [Acetivibrio cellulolyticus]